MIRPCEREWSAEKATRIRLLVVKLTGEACPCDQGKQCPLLPMLEAGALPGPEVAAEVA